MVAHKWLTVYYCAMISPSLTRTFAGILSFSLTWTLTIGVLIYGMVGMANAFIFYAGSMWNDLVGNWNGDATFGGVLHLPYLPKHVDLIPYLMWSFEIAAFLLSLAILWFWLGSIRQSVRCMNVNAVKLNKEHPIYQLVKMVCDNAKGVRMPAVYLSPDQAMNAFALSKPFRSAIILNQGILSIPKPELAWVIAHELGHIRHGDADSSTLWLSIRQVERLANYARYLFIRMAYPLILRVPLFLLIAAPIRWLLSGLIYATDKAAKASQFIFLFIDRYAQREMEYRADAYACRVIKVKFGLDALYTLGGYIEGNYDAFASHPPVAKRMERLEKLEKLVASKM